MQIGIFASTGGHLDSFFPDMGHHLEALGHSVHYGAGTPARKVAVTTVPHVTQRPRLVNLRAPGQIRAWVRKHRLDVVVTNMATGSALARLRDVGAPVVYFAHGLHWNDATAATTLPWRLVEQILLRRTTAMIVLSDEDAVWVRSHSSLPCLQLPYGVGLTPARYPRSENPRNGEVAWISEFSKRKRPHLALAVAQELLDRGEDFHLTMLGEGALLEEVRATVADSRSLRGRVSLPGFGDAAATLERCTVLLHTSTWEGLPRVMLEAMSVGRPTAAFDVKGVRRLPAVHLAPDADVVALTQVLRELLHDPPPTKDFPDPELMHVRHVAGQVSDFLESSVA